MPNHFRMPLTMKICFFTKFTVWIIKCQWKSQYDNCRKFQDSWTKTVLRVTKACD